MSIQSFSVAAILGWLTIFLTSLAGFVTHIVVCIQTKMWLLLIAGAILPPIGVIHGIGIWFGAWA